MTDNFQNRTSSESAIFYIIGIDTEGCHALRYVTDKGDYEGVMLVAIHSNEIALARSGADETVLLEIDKLTRDESGFPDKATEDYITIRLGASIKQGDAFFILPELGQEKSSGLTTCICKLLSEKFKRGRSSFVLAIANAPGQDEKPTRQKAFWLGYKQLLEQCDTVIINTAQEISQQNQQRQSTLSCDLTQCVETTYQAIKSITNLILHPGLCCFDFSDAAAIFVNRGEATIATGSGVGDGRGFVAIHRVSSQLKGQWGSLSNPDIGAVLINIAATDVSLKELDVVSNFFRLQVSSSTTIKIGTTLDNTMPDNELRVTAILVKDNAENLGGWSQYRK